MRRQAVETDVARALLAEDVIWCAAHPINDHIGAESVFSAFWDPILHALPDVEYRPLVRVAGPYDGEAMDGDGAAGDWVNSTGYLVGTFRLDWFCRLPGKMVSTIRQILPRARCPSGSCAT